MEEGKGEAEEIRPHALAVSLYLMVLYGLSYKVTRLLADVKRLIAEIMLPRCVVTLLEYLAFLVQNMCAQSKCSNVRLQVDACSFFSYKLSKWMNA